MLNNRPKPVATTGRPGRDAVLDAAADLLGRCRLADVMAFAGVRAVADEAGLAPGTVSYHFPPSGNGPAGHGKVNAGLAAAGVRHAITRDGYAITDESLTELANAIDELEAGDIEGLARVAAIAQNELVAYSTESRRASETATYLAAAVAPRDETAAKILRDHYGTVTDMYIPALEAVCAAMGRRLVPDISSSDFALIVSCLAEGFLFRRRFDPERARVELFAEMVPRLIESVTVEAAVVDFQDPIDTLVLPRGSQLDPHKRRAIVAAATALYDRNRNWDDVTVGAVADDAGVKRATVLAHFGSRAGLAAPVWARYIVELRAAINLDASRPLHRLVWGHLQRTAELIRHHHALTAALMDAMLLYSGPPVPDKRDPRDPRRIAPFTGLLGDELYRQRGALRPGIVDSREAAVAFSELVTAPVIQLALFRPALPSAEVADYVVNTVMIGALARRPASPR